MAASTLHIYDILILWQNYPVPLVWDRKTHLFRITCHQDIAMHVTQACLGTLREITDHQIGINDDDEESDVDMVADGESSDPEEDESDVEQDEGAQSTSNIVPLKKIKDFSISIESELAEALLRYPQSLNGYTYKKSWKREDSNGFALVAADAVLQEIGLLTNARLARHPYQNVIYVGSDNKESCDKAVSKLEVLFRYAVRSQAQDFTMIFKLMFRTRRSTRHEVIYSIVKTLSSSRLLFVLYTIVKRDYSSQLISTTAPNIFMVILQVCYAQR